MARGERIAGISGEAAARRLVIVDLALSVQTASPDARILALVVRARLGVRTIGVLNALGSASVVRIAGVIGQARAGSSAVSLVADGVRAARRRVARLARRLRRDDDPEIAGGERIALVVLVTLADRSMIPGDTVGVDSAGSDAGVLTVVAQTGEVVRTVLIDYALWSTIGRCTEHASYAGADRTILLDSALGVRSAGRRQARIARRHRLVVDDTLEERIADEAGRTAADRIVGVDLALGVQAAHAVAGVAALLIDAGEMRSALRADQTLRTAGRRCSTVTRTARANGSVVGHSADTVWSARRRGAGILRWSGLLVEPAGLEGVARVACDAGAAWHVVVDLALSVGTADSGARISAMLIETSEVTGAVGVYRALGLAASGVGVAYVGWNA